MKNIYSNIFPFNKKTLNKMIANLKKGYVVGLPTETVYGLAGNAYSKESVKKIYSLKKRPHKNPLIIHYLNYQAMQNDAVINDDFLKLYEKLCPGPITFVLKKKVKSKISPLALGKLKTVAVRFPSHRIIRNLLNKISFPLAMPSANISSRVSPVTAEHVAEEFKKKIKFILNGGRSKVGIESTVIDLTGKPNIIRPGIIDPQRINKILKKKINILKKTKRIKSPGMFGRHYSPGIPIILNKIKSSKNNALITFGKRYKNRKNYFNLSKSSNLLEAASNLYKILRKIKKLDFKMINVVKIPNKGPGIAINDRLKRAAYK